MMQQRNGLPAEQLLGFDPWSVTVDERRRLAQRYSDAQDHWLEVITALVEPPRPRRDFPAFLLATPRFERLRRAIEHATCRRDLDTATADELQRFVDCYRDYLNAPAA